MRLGIGMSLQSFYFPTRGRSEIGIFGPLPTREQPGWGSDVDERVQAAELSRFFASQERWIVSFDGSLTDSHRVA
jgi:hypothetical protein